MRVAFFHPDLGIGGAERLVVDAAVSLKNRGHSVHVFTGFHEQRQGRCFQETMPGGSIPVSAYGTWIPRSVCGRLHVVMAWLRMLYVFTLFSCTGRFRRFDVAVCDQVSLLVPLLRYLLRFPVLFYCHFPDMMLASHHSKLRRCYRCPFDALERWSTGCAHAVAVNSAFTAGVVRECMPNLVDRNLRVLYPPVPPLQEEDGEHDEDDDESILQDMGLSLSPQQQLLLSINRYERKKNLPAALHTLAELEMGDEVILVFAGGHDTRVPENQECLEELQTLAQSLGLQNQVLFLKNISREQKSALLRRANCLLYTPAREHFGIVPVEAMQAGCPVVAISSGGPLESIVDGTTGYLVDEGDIRSMADAVLRILTNSEHATAMGREGQQRVQELFSLQSFGETLEQVLVEVRGGVADGAAEEGVKRA